MTDLSAPDLDHTRTCALCDKAITYEGPFLVSDGEMNAALLLRLNEAVRTLELCRECARWCWDDRSLKGLRP